MGISQTNGENRGGECPEQVGGTLGRVGLLRELVSSCEHIIVCSVCPVDKAVCAHLLNSCISGIGRSGLWDIIGDR